MTIRRRIALLLMGLVGLQAPAGLASQPMPQAGIVADAHSAAAWVADALTQSGYKADFTVESFAELDRFFDEQAQKGIPKSDGLLGQQLGARLFAIGAYVGETLRRQRGGEWVGDDKDPKAEINISVKLPDGTVFWPVQRVMKRLKNGNEDGLAAYGTVLAGTK